MKKSAYLLTALTVLVILGGVVEARLTGTNPTGASADAFCVGKKSSEVCVASNGDILPTTTGVSSLGTSSLAWLNGYIASLTVSTGLSVTGNFAPQSLTTTQIQGKTPSAVGQIVYNSTLKLVCVSTGTTIEGYSLSGSAAGCQ